MRLQTVSCTFAAGLLLLLSSWLSPCCATLDLSNVDLQNFRFFKYPHQKPPSPVVVRQLSARLVRPGPGGHAPPMFVLRKIVRVHQPVAQMEAGPLSKVRAIFGYVTGVLFGNLPNEPEIPVRFHPDTAYRLREMYQRKFGFRGEHLIEQLGKGGPSRPGRGNVNG